jgi:predicted ATP-dependent Lon-type protease
MKTLILSFSLIVCLSIAAAAQTTCVINDTGHGTQIGTSATQGVSFFGVSPVIQQSGAADLIATLAAYGLLSSGTQATPLNLHGGALTVGSITITGSSAWVTLTGSQTLTNKTLTAPVLSAPVITGSMTLSGTASVPSESGTAALWIPVISGTSTYRLPLYE